MYSIGSSNYINSVRPSSLIPVSNIVPPITRVPRISRDDIEFQTMPTNVKTEKAFETTLNKYLSRYEGQTQIDYAGNNNTPYDKAVKEMEESIVLGMNFDMQV
jgi:hypothetical protein